MEKAVRIPKLGWVRLAEKLRYDGKILGATVSRRADDWFIAIQVEVPDEFIPTRENQAVGIDLGINSLVTLSNGTKVKGAKAGPRYARQLKRLNQSLSRKVGAKRDEEQSRNFKKAKRKLARLYAKIANLRADQTHKLTAQLVQNHTLIGIEDLNVRGMMSNHKLAGSVADMSFYEFRRQLEYKAMAIGTQVIVADRWFPSSKTCSVCGNIKSKEELKLSTRVYACYECGFVCDRDINAATNLMDYALKHA